MVDFEERALRLLRSPRFFQYFLAAVKEAGLAGEEQTALITFIVCISRFLEKPLSLFIKGRSSSGKNFLASIVLMFILKQHLFELSSATEAAWNYYGRRLMHKIVYEQEIIGTRGSMYGSRLMLSEGNLIRWVTGWKNGKRITQRVVTTGPIASISTTTKTKLLIDDESRRVSVWIDESEEQTRRIMNRSFESQSGLPEEDMNTWHIAQKMLRERAKKSIELPKWIREATEYISAHDVRVRRYFPAFLVALKTVCILRSFRRMKHHEAAGVLRIGFVDFAITTMIFEKAFSDSLSKGEEQDEEIRSGVEVISARNSVKQATIGEIAQRLGISYHVARRRVQQAEKSGIIAAATSQRRRNNLKSYVVAARRGFLPDPAQIFQKVDHRLNRVRFVHPLTGKWVTYERKRT